MGSDGPVIDNTARSRFELALPGDATAFIDYYTRDSTPRVRVLTHAEVPVQLRGGGIGARLTAGVLQLLRARGEKAVPVCPYIVDFLRRHPDYADVVAD
jgi:hypothetical protein